MNWFKSLFGIGEKIETDYNGPPLVKDFLPMPKVKLRNAKNISAPVFAMVSAWKENPKRFTFSSTTSVYNLFNWDGGYSYNNYRKTPRYDLEVRDNDSKEVFVFGVWLSSESYSDAYNSTHFLYSRLIKHRIYPVLGSKVYSKPSWMTQDELDYIKEAIKPYYLKRVNRFRDIVESRLDRARKASEMKSEIAKQKERDRLTGVYK